MSSSKIKDNIDWKKQFIYLYRNALKALLDGASIDVYARMLNVELPNVSGLKLGKKFPI